MKKTIASVIVFLIFSCTSVNDKNNTDPEQFPWTEGSYHHWVLNEDETLTIVISEDKTVSIMLVEAGYYEDEEFFAEGAQFVLGYDYADIQWDYISNIRYKILEKDGDSRSLEYFDGDNQKFIMSETRFGWSIKDNESVHIYMYTEKYDTAFIE